MTGDAGADVWYPSVDDILLIHDDIIAEDEDASPGVRDADRIVFAIEYVRDGHFGEVPETIHEKAFHLMRLLASNHWFADGNKRTALNSAELFYLVNGYELEYGEDIRSMLKLFSVRESLIDRGAGPAYLEDQAAPIEMDEETGSWESLALVVVAALVEYADVDPDEFLDDERQWPARHEWGRTTGYDGNVNTDDDQENPDYGG